jgi:transcription initiation factor TFIIIB Brf1 subunit/transcription initiation factor TFIIB
MATVVVLIYYDLRVRKEQLSIDELARAVRIDPSSVDRTRFERPDDSA